jgi:hypothetical protein
MIESEIGCQVKPYVYMAINPNTEEFYFGYRRANKVNATEDIGKIYFSSADYITENKEQFEWLIVDEFETGDEAYEYEQYAIRKNKDNPLLLNKKYQNIGTKIFYVTAQGREKQRAAKLGKAPWNKGLKFPYKPLSESHKLAISKGTTGVKKKRTHPCSEETRKHLSEINKGRVPWSKGLTKETDSRIADIADKVSKKHTGIKHSKERREIESIAAKNRHNPKVSCLCCKKVYDLRNFAKHLNSLGGKTITCLCCRKEYSPAKFKQHMDRVSCLHCRKEFDKGNFKQHINKLLKMEKELL